MNIYFSGVQRGFQVSDPNDVHEIGAKKKELQEFNEIAYPQERTEIFGFLNDKDQYEAVTLTGMHTSVKDNVKVIDDRLREIGDLLGILPADRLNLTAAMDSMIGQALKKPH